MAKWYYFAKTVLNYLTIVLFAKNCSSGTLFIPDDQRALLII